MADAFDKERFEGELRRQQDANGRLESSSLEALAEYLGELCKQLVKNFVRHTGELIKDALSKGADWLFEFFKGLF